MIDEAQLRQLLGDNGIPVSDGIVRDGRNVQRFYVFIDVMRDKNNRQFPSNKKLHELRDSLKDAGIEIEFVLTDGVARDIEIGLRASLLHAFPDIIRNSFLTVDGKNAYVWLDSKRGVSAEEQSSIKQKIAMLLASYGLEIGLLRFTSDDNLPSKTACIRALRRIAPADLSEVADTLRKSGFTVPSADWMSRMLDKLRKNGSIVRMKSGKYALSSAELRVQGTAKNTRSPDISRMLDIARRGV